jgi:hypothetical protein
MDKIPLPTPCTLDWRKMTPADGGRFCGDCKKVVRDLSKMSEEEARALLRTPRREDLCIRFLTDRYGKVVFEKSLVPVSRLTRIAAVVALPFATQACEAMTELAPVSSTTQNHDETNPDTHDYSDNMGGAPAPKDFEKWENDAGNADANADGGDAADAGYPEPT